MNQVFADTFYWIALIHRQDSSHQAVLNWGRSAGQLTIATTDEILSEVLTYFSGLGRLRADAARVVRGIIDSPTVIVTPQSHDSFMGALPMYESRPDKGYSLTDCISMHQMRREGLTDVLTNDRHFEQEGFRVLFRE